MKLKKIIIYLLIIICLISFIILIIGNKNNEVDTLIYNNKKYVYLEYNMDIFNYEYNSNYYYETDIIHEIEHDKWDMIYFNGDLFVYEKEVKEAKKYYADDDNYQWAVIVEEDEMENEFPILINNNELKYLYNMDNVKKEETMLFDEIEKFGTLKKVSKDKTIFAITCLAYFKNFWYWRTETIDVNKENDPEYVIKLPKTLNEKINSLIIENVK